MKTGKYTEQAETMKKALLAFADHPENIDNFTSYLSNHFENWLAKFANTPEKLAEELFIFSSMDI